MRRGLSRFAELLRREGLAVSPAELIDAAAALAVTDLADREALQLTLRAVLVKRRAEGEPFDRLFASFFAAPAGAPVAGRRRARAGRPAGEPGGGDRAGRGGAGGGRPAAGAVPRPDGRPGEAPRRSAASRAAGGRAAPRGPSIVRAPHRRAPPAAPVARRAPPAPERPSPAAAAGAARARAAAGVVAPGDVTRKPFREAWSQAESRRLAEELVRLLARLRLRRARRRRRARRGALWVQRVVRANVGHDGVPLQLVRRRPARREPRLLLLVDVSHSVRQAAAAFMTVVAGLTRAFRDVRVVFFVDQPVEVTALLPRLARLAGSADALAALARGVPELNDLAPSDYGRVLDRLARETAPGLRANTLVLILGDARTNRLDPQAWALEALRSRARRVVWLVPEAVEQWHTGDSALAAYAPHCDLLVESADLAGLAHGLRRALAS